MPPTHRTPPALPDWNKNWKKLHIGAAFAQYIPHTQPCKTTRVIITLALDWKPQVEHMVGVIQDKGAKLIYNAKHAGASHVQSIHLIQTAIKPAVTYTMTVAPTVPGTLRD